MADSAYQEKKLGMSITFGDQAENHVGMQMIGKGLSRGFSRKDLEKALKRFVKEGYECELISLTDALPSHLRKEVKEADACVLVVRNGVKAFTEVEGLYKEQEMLNFDKKAKMKGRVVNKKARWNLCYGEESQDPDYEGGKGTIVGFEKVPQLNRVRELLPKYFGELSEGLVAELNVYYDMESCGIGFHGDAERKVVVCLRLGASKPLHYQWYQRSSAVGERVIIPLREGDIYAMSEKAVGFDWMKKIVPTLRHATGGDSFVHPAKKRKMNQ